MAKQPINPSSKQVTTISTTTTSKTDKTDDAGAELKQKIRMELLQFMADQVTTPNHAVTPSKGTPGKTLSKDAPALSLPKTAPDRTVDLRNQQKRDIVKEQQEANDIYKAGDVVDQHYLVAFKLKDGGFGQVYKVIDNKSHTELALKVEKNFSSVPGEYFEGTVFKSFQGHTNCPRMYSIGFVANYVYIAMQLLGENLSEIRKACPLAPSRFSASAAYRTTIQCLKAVEGLHNLGYIHRDIKPSNFAVGKEPKLSHIVYMLDFGLCRTYVNRDGTLKKPRDNVGFRGTVRYASMTAHEKKDLSRRDDLLSLFYTFVELLTGQLPWRKTNDKDKVAQMKRRYSPEVLCQVLPTEVGDFLRNIEKLNFIDKPDYNGLDACLKKYLLQIPAKMEDPYDWQLSDCKLIKHWYPPK